MSDEETVVLHVSIRISTEGEVDTGISLSEWNAMTDDERSDIAAQIWTEEAASNDGGGKYVITEGAAEI